MRYFLATCLYVTVSFIITACNNNSKNNETTTTADSLSGITDTVRTTNDSTAKKPDNLKRIKELSDSFNLAIRKMDTIIIALSDSANLPGVKNVHAILVERDRVTQLRDRATQSRTTATGKEMKELSASLDAIVARLKSSALKLQKLGDQVERVVTIFGFLETAVTAIVGNGILSIPVAVAAGTP